MKRGYFWIPQTDFSLNGIKHGEAKVIGNIKVDFKNGYVEFRLNNNFPIGTIFHFMHNKVDYVIFERVKAWGLKYRARRADGEKLTGADFQRFTSGRSIYRSGQAETR